MTTDLVATNLRLEHGVAPTELDHVVDVFAKLDQHLRPFANRIVDLRLHVKERKTPSQHTTLEADIAGLSHLVATSDDPDFDRALAEVRDELARQLTDAKDRADPHHGKAHQGHG